MPTTPSSINFRTVRGARGRHALAKNGVFLCERFCLDRRARTLFRSDAAGAFVPIAIGTRALDVLDVLVGRAGDLVSRDELQQAIRLSPRDPYISVWYYRIGVVHLLQSDIDEAILWLEKSAATRSALATARAGLASAYALTGEIERAGRELAEARRLDGGDRYSTIARLRAAEDLGVPKVRALFEATYFAGLRKAGMPKG